MFKHLMIIATLVSGISAARANTLDNEFKRICTETGVESQDIPVEAAQLPVKEVNKIVMAQLSADNVDSAKKAIGLLPEDMLWLAVFENDEGVTLYGEELPDDNVAVLMLILQGDAPMLMYIEGDKEVAKHINFN